MQHMFSVNNPHTPGTEAHEFFELAASIAARRIDPTFAEELDAARAIVEAAATAEARAHAKVAEKAAKRALEDAELSFEHSAILDSRHLKSKKTTLGRENTRVWRSVRGRALLELGAERFAYFARQYDLDRAAAAELTMMRTDLISYIWEIWNSPAFLEAKTPWGYTNEVLGKRLGYANKLDRLRTSHSADERTPMTGEVPADGSYNPMTVLFADNGGEAITNSEDSVSIEAARRSAELEPAFRSPALNRVVTLLVTGGLVPEQASALVEYVVERATAATSPARAYDAAARDAKVVAARLEIPEALYRATVNLVLGNSSGDIGVIEAELRGIDPRTVKNIVKNKKKLSAFSR
ncbi:hypothetical protein SAMN05216368_10928 [Cryobacterium flavum]|uniref:Uncharacterized protein n=1 Tax=Cryobacterium flavum TaxID=1424659 RepID=A0A4R8V1J4_9MICO|nr:hypothetical protein [Cryobacterium flavum]TFB76094.1 hypothetical protein E3O21_11610 [Cryobacterium flavum]SDO00727.1 hypothetical protein SAMN05216368_10928 [Cryobacterium flavum]